MVTCTTPPFRAAVRLNSGVRPVQKQMPVNKHQAKLALFFPRLGQTFDPRHKLRAGKNAGTPFLGLASSQRAVVEARLRSDAFVGKSTAGTGLTIRSSRDRFAASCRFC